MDLFATEANLQIVRVTAQDVLLRTDLLKTFEAAIIRHEAMYPSISKWLKEKVLPGIENNSRIAYLGFCNDSPVVTAVAKRGKSTKFCHLHIDKEIQDKNLGELFFALMVIDVRHIAHGIHFTLPESLWEREQDFFRSFGFDNVQKAPTQYRSFEEELLCASSFDQVWQSTMEKLPKLIDLHSIDEQNISNGLLMSIRPQYIKKIFSGDKLIEIRKKFNHKWSSRRVTLYSSHPTKAVVGYAVIQCVISDTPKNIWENYGYQLGCSKAEFDTYTEGLNKIYAIQLNNINPYRSPMPLTQLSWFLDQTLIPPQSYASLKENKNWLNAISIADILQGKFSTVTQAI
jgi:predicted transcriptional regulator